MVISSCTFSDSYAFVIVVSMRKLHSLYTNNHWSEIGLFSVSSRSEQSPLPYRSSSEHLPLTPPIFTHTHRYRSDGSHTPRPLHSTTPSFTCTSPPQDFAHSPP